MPEVPKIDAQSEHPCLSSLEMLGMYCAEELQVFFPSSWQKLTVLHIRTCEGCWRMISTCSLCLLKWQCFSDVKDLTLHRDTILSFFFLLYIQGRYGAKSQKLYSTFMLLVDNVPLIIIRGKYLLHLTDIL